MTAPIRIPPHPVDPVDQHEAQLLKTAEADTIHFKLPYGKGASAVSTHPIAATIAKIPIDDAAEDAVIDIAARAMKTARRIGNPTRDPVAAIYDQRIKRQARRLLLAAAMHLYGDRNFTVRQILVSLSSIDLAGADNHEAMAECWERIEDTARDMARQCREYAGDAR